MAGYILDANGELGIGENGTFAARITVEGFPEKEMAKELLDATRQFVSLYIKKNMGAHTETDMTDIKGNA